MLTSRAQPTDIVSALENGADDFIPKPFEAAALVARIRAVLRRILGAPTQQETRLLTAGAGLKANAELPLVKILARESLGLI